MRYLAHCYSLPDFLPSKVPILDYIILFFLFVLTYIAQLSPSITSSFLHLKPPASSICCSYSPFLSHSFQNNFTQFFFIEFHVLWNISEILLEICKTAYCHIVLMFTIYLSTGSSCVHKKLFQIVSVQTFKYIHMLQINKCKIILTNCKLVNVKIL